MKMKLNENLDELSSVASPYYCGSACFLSTLFLVREILASSEKKMKKEFSTMEKQILSLYEEDPVLFSLSKKEELSVEDWKKAEEIFLDYASFIEKMSLLLDVCSKSDKERYVPLIRHSKDFIVSLAFENMSAFASRNDVPEDFNKVRNEVFMASKRG
jgi:hypothetical protein